MIEPKSIVRSKRKTLAFVIDKNGDLIVKAPKWISNQEIMDYVQKKQDWIIKKSQLMKEKTDKVKSLEIKDGEQIFFQGSTYRIRMAVCAKIKLEENEIKIPNLKMAKQLLVDWYKMQAKTIIPPRVLKIAHQVGVAPAEIKINSAKSRWGSCSAKQRVNFSYHLVMCPEKVIDYVIVHELCHINHMNHSKDFWQNVEEIMPDYKEQENWLKTHSYFMELL